MMTFFPTDGHGFTLIHARAALVLGCIAEDFNLTQTIRNSQTFADCSAPAASGTQSYLTQNSRKSRNRTRVACAGLHRGALSLTQTAQKTQTDAEH